MLQIRNINATLRLGLLDLAAFSSQRSIIVKRDLERAGTTFLLQEMLKSIEVKLDYSPHRKPFFSDRTEHLSISHSHDKLAILINENESTGVDIELIRDKVLNISHKFLSPIEAEYCGKDPEKMIVVWAAKEAMYKVYGQKELEFIKHISVEKFHDNVLRGHLHLDEKQRSFNLRSEKIENYMLVYVLNEL